MHQELAVSQKSQSKLSLTPASSSKVSKRVEAECKMAVLTACSNVPLAFHDRLSPMIREVFSDSDVAANYHSASTKATCILNLAVAPAFKIELIENMKLHPFSISVDGSNDTGLLKMNPLTVRIFDVNLDRIVTRFLDMCSASSATAENLYNTFDMKLQELLDSVKSREFLHFCWC